MRNKVNRNFLEISYGSLQESRYLLDFCLKERYIHGDDYEKASDLGDKIGAMLWGIISKL